MTDSEKLDLILSEMQKLKRRTTNIELHLENTTDKNIQLIAENFSELTNKLNQAIPVAICQGLFYHYGVSVNRQNGQIIID